MWAVTEALLAGILLVLLTGLRLVLAGGFRRGTRAPREGGLLRPRPWVDPPPPPHPRTRDHLLAVHLARWVEQGSAPRVPLEILSSTTGWFEAVAVFEGLKLEAERATAKPRVPAHVRDALFREAGARIVAEADCPTPAKREGKRSRQARGAT